MNKKLVKQHNGNPTTTRDLHQTSKNLSPMSSPQRQYGAIASANIQNQKSNNKSEHTSLNNSLIKKRSNDSKQHSSSIEQLLIKNRYASNIHLDSASQVKRGSKSQLRNGGDLQINPFTNNSSTERSSLAPLDHKLSHVKSQVLKNYLGGVNTSIKSGGLDLESVVSLENVSPKQIQQPLNHSISIQMKQSNDPAFILPSTQPYKQTPLDQSSSLILESSIDRQSIYAHPRIKPIKVMPSSKRKRHDYYMLQPVQRPQNERSCSPSILPYYPQVFRQQPMVM